MVLAGHLMGYTLVTGAAGYIGTVVCQILLENRFNVIAIDNLSGGSSQTRPDPLIFFQVDIGDKSSLDQIFSKYEIDSVIHLAGVSIVSHSLLNPRNYFHNNLINSLTLLDSMIEHDVGQIVFASSAAVYGTPIFPQISENDPAIPSSPYGISKSVIETVLATYAVSYGLKSVSLRYFNVVGSYGQYGEIHTPETHLIPNVIQVGTGMKNVLKIYGNDFPTADGTVVRDYVHVEDVALANIQALASLPNLPKGVYNVGLGQGCSILEIVKMVEKILRRKVPVEFQPRRLGDPPSLIADATAIRRDIGWHPKHNDLEEMLSGAVRWHRSNF